MKTFNQFLTETKEVLQERSRSKKPAFGKADGDNYAVQIDGIDRNDFFNMPWGHQVDTIRYIQNWKKTAKSSGVDAKGKATLAAVKAWVKDFKPKEFYAKWKADSSWYKDDGVEIFYK